MRSDHLLLQDILDSIRDVPSLELPVLTILSNLAAEPDPPQSA